MTMELHEEIFDEFKQAALTVGCYPSGLKDADQTYLEYLSRWQDIVAFRQVDLPKTSTQFDTAGVVVPISRNRKKMKNNAQLETLIVGADTASGRVLVMRGKPMFGQLE